ncbi:MAG: class I SAM-dependent methyltransferase [Sphingomonas sp.]|nr:class I SAM-dependent methyltransferase [Sphingomonas sp.]
MSLRSFISRQVWRHTPNLAHWYRSRVRPNAFAGLSPRDAFSKIYAENLWGDRDSGKGSSGLGSHSVAIVDPYVSAISEYLKSRPRPLRLVDLGCGDMAVGQRLIPLADAYIGCDVVPALIQEHRANFVNAQFECLDIIDDALPGGDVVLIRQVLQHLGNEQISRILPKLRAYDAIIITEHLPSGAFKPNLNHSMSDSTRIERNSGVVIGVAPFEFPGFRDRLLVSVPAEEGTVIQTKVFERAN